MMICAVGDIKCIGLNVVRRPGYLVAIEKPLKGREWQHLGEWPVADEAREV